MTYPWLFYICSVFVFTYCFGVFVDLKNHILVSIILNIDQFRRHLLIFNYRAYRVSTNWWPKRWLRNHRKYVWEYFVLFLSISADGKHLHKASPQRLSLLSTTSRTIHVVVLGNSDSKWNCNHLFTNGTEKNLIENRNVTRNLFRISSQALNTSSPC